MTTQTFAEAALSGLSQNERWRRRHLQASNDDDETPAVEKRATSPLPTHSGELTALEEQIQSHQNKLAASRFLKNEKRKLADLKERLAHQKQGPPKTAADFARRLKYGR